MVTLNSSDARTVDLMLDRAAAVRGNGGMQFAAEPGVSGEKVAAVEKLLNLLDAMPAAEPPADLLERTLERVGASTGSMHPDHFLRPEMSQPVA